MTNVRTTPRQTAAARMAQSLADRRRILEFNQRARNVRHTNALPDQSGYVQFSMHELDYWRAVLKYPELRLGDGMQRKKAWEKFLNSPEGEKYKINPREGKKIATPRGIIVR